MRAAAGFAPAQDRGCTRRQQPKPEEGKTGGEKRSKFGGASDRVAEPPAIIGETTEVSKAFWSRMWIKR
jgi:hypothetical protein